MLNVLTNIIEEECRNAIEYGIFGTQDFHIESIERIDDKEGALFFKVTTWNNQAEESRCERFLDLFEVMDLLGRVIGHRGIRNAVEVF